MFYIHRIKISLQDWVLFMTSFIKGFPMESGLLYWLQRFYTQRRPIYLTNLRLDVYNYIKIRINISVST